MKRYFISYAHPGGFGNAFVDNLKCFNINKQSRIIEEMNNYPKDSVVIINFIKLKSNETHGFLKDNGEEQK